MTKLYAIQFTNTTTDINYYFYSEDKHKLLDNTKKIKDFVYSRASQVELYKMRQDLNAVGIDYVTDIFDEPPACDIIDHWTDRL